MKYSIFSKSGQILRLVDCHADIINLQLGKDESVLDGWFSDSEYYVKNNIAIPFPKKPWQFCYFDYAKEIWIKDYPLAEQHVKSQRNILLTQSDWTQLPDVPLQAKQAWAEYRQALRDITDQPGYPFDIVWPQAPN